MIHKITGYLPRNLLGQLKQDSFATPMLGFSIPKKFGSIKFAGKDFLETADGDVCHPCLIQIQNLETNEEWEIRGYVSTERIMIKTSYGTSEIDIASLIVFRDVFTIVNRHRESSELLREHLLRIEIN